MTRFLAAAVLLTLMACGTPPQNQPAGRLQVVATTGMIGDTARRVAGDAADVTALMGPGVDPHLYKATASDVTTLQGADLVLYNGLNLEGKMGEVFEAVSKAGKPVVAVAEGVDRAKLLFPEQFQGHPDPHVWFDVALWSETVQPIVDGLSKADPERAADYARRGEELRKELAELDAWCRQQVERVPAERRVLVTSHDAFNYFGKAYGFEVVGLQGISTVTEAGMNDMTAMIDLVKKRGIPAVFVESSVPKAAIERVSQDSGAKVGGELFSDAMGAAGTEEGTYPGMVRHNVNTIVGALGP